jgi:hypothetical protein
VKKLASRVLLLGAFLAALFASLEATARALYPPNPLPLEPKVAALWRQAASIETLVMGNSHAAHGINPAYLSGAAFNLAYPATDMYNNYHVLAKVAPRLPRLRRVVLNLSWHSFAFSATGDSPFLVSQFWFALGVWPQRLKLVTPVRLAMQRSRYWWLRHRFVRDMMLYGLQPRPPEQPLLASESWLGNGFRETPYALSPGKLAQHAVERAARHEALHGAGEFRAGNRGLLREFLALAQQDGRSVVLVTLPTSRAYHDLYPAELRAEFSSDLAGVLGVFPRVAYYDFSAAPELGDGDFRDADHLNTRGAAKFTPLLDAWLSSLRQ